MALTKLFPMVQFKKDTWEIDEFDCASIYLLIGTEKAMVIDCGMGIGDLYGAIRQITDKPLITVISHGHVDHTGNARQFGEIWINPKDADQPIPQSLERRKFDTERIAARQKGSIGVPYTLFRLYPFDINVDLRDPVDEPIPVIHDLTDGMQFDLGGGRIVTAYECPGHSAGEMVFLDEATRTLFAGDAINYNLGIGRAPLETTLKALKRIQAMSDKYDGIWNSHHDFRALGMPVEDDCLPNIIAMCEDALAGHIVDTDNGNPWGQKMPLSKDGGGSFHWGNNVTLHKGRNLLSLNPDNLFENK